MKNTNAENKKRLSKIFRQAGLICSGKHFEIPPPIGPQSIGWAESLKEAWKEDKRSS